MNPDICCRQQPPNGERYSVEEVSWQEAKAFKWIASQQAGCDLGEPAIQLWINKHWSGFLRSRWIEHLQGKRCWLELGEEDFGLLNREFNDQQSLLNPIVSYLIDGKENLEIIAWAVSSQVPVDAIVRILERINVNARRLIAKYDGEWKVEADQCHIVKSNPVI